MKTIKKNRVFITNCPVDVLTANETLDIIEKSINNGDILHHVVVNAGKLVNMQKDYDLYESVVQSDIINADGQSIVWASKLLGDHLPERVAGIDLMESLIKMAYEKKFTCYFLGAKEVIVKSVVEIYSRKYSPEIIAGYRNGYFNEHEGTLIAQEIADSKADILFVAITSPKKEIFLNKYKETLRIPFITGVGGSFDVVAGLTKRAPLWMQKAGLEWLYRLIQEPRRMWKRYIIGNAKFVYLIIKQKFGRYKNPFDVINP